MTETTPAQDKSDAIHFKKMNCTIVSYLQRWELYQDRFLNCISNQIVEMQQQQENQISLVLEKKDKSRITINFYSFSPSKNINIKMDFDILWCWKFPIEYVPQPSGLRWIQTISAGVDQILEKRSLPEEIIITNAKGFQAEPIAEYVLGAILGHAKGLFYNVQANKDKRMKSMMPDTLNKKVLGIIGTGNIGSKIAQIARNFGLKTIGLKKHPGRRPAGFERVYLPSDATDFYKTVDYLVIAAPLTPETRNMINDRVLRLLPQGAYLVNVGRGEIIVEEDLIRAVKEGHLSGATLDVWRKKTPQPDFFDQERFLITPHFSGFSRYYAQHAATIFGQNLLRFINREPLNFVIDRSNGY
ncbi:D-2-hydroxyacid dehydrogenase [candidate division CSSED10-310 bacterium]|uniref:D-2-hydroxyacid dehydrogenase n=1 Tax=candidate division CSSED10-310 bacterium TaxID=2855610 RepID=A0ABV6Z3K2_UNCC1